MHTRNTITSGLIALALLAFTASPVLAQTGPKFLGLGDSIGEGVQSGDASQATQPFSFLNLMAWRMGAEFPIPLIRTGLFASVGDTTDRSRALPTVRSYNLAVSGADVASILFDRATAASVAEIDSETELVLFPQVGSQIEIAEQLRPEYVACWIGNNDALGAALAFDRLDGSQLTPVAQFAANFTQLADRLQAIGAKAVFGTIPDITGIGVLLNRQDLIRFLGSAYGLPQGSLTSVPAMMLVKLGLADPAVFSDPNWVLDPAEQQKISNHVNLLNDVIRTTVEARGFALVETHGIFEYLSENPLNLFGVSLTTRFLGGLFSLDGVHPSNIGQGLVAFFFIEALNQRYGADIPQIDGQTLWQLTATDPFIDKDGDGRPTGRFGAGLLETVFSILSISGDTNDGTLPLPGAAVAPAAFVRTLPPAPRSPSATADTMAATRALDEYARATGRDLRRMSRAEQADALRTLFGTTRRHR